MDGLEGCLDKLKKNTVTKYKNYMFAFMKEN